MSTKTVYSKNDVSFDIRKESAEESSVHINVGNTTGLLCWISNSEREDFVKTLSDVFDGYAI